MERIKTVIFSITLIFLPRILVALHVGKMLAVGIGTLAACATWYIPSKSEAHLPLWKWLLLAVPSSVVSAVFFKSWFK